MPHLVAMTADFFSALDCLSASRTIPRKRLHENIRMIEQRVARFMGGKDNLARFARLGPTLRAHVPAMRQQPKAS